jgi:hypothetical protein
MEEGSRPSWQHVADATIDKRLTKVFMVVSLQVKRWS